MRKLIQLAAVAFFLAVAAVGALFFLYTQGYLKAFEAQLKKRVIAAIVEKIQPHLPFTIESLEVETDWKDLFSGRVRALKLVARRGDWRFRLAGPADLGAISYDPILTYESVSDSGFRAEPVDVSLRVTLPMKIPDDIRRWVETDFATVPGEIREISLKASTPRISRSSHVPVQIDQPRLDVLWSAGKAVASASAGTIDWTSAENGADTVSIVAPSTRVTADLALSPFKVGETFPIQWQTKSAELLIGDTYLDFPAWILGGNGVARTDSSGLKQATLAITPFPGKRIEISARPARDAWTIDWNAPALELTSIIEELMRLSSGGGAFASLSGAKELEIKAGSLTSRGSVTLTEGGSISALRGNFDLSGATLKSEKNALAAQDVSARIKMSSLRDITGTVGAGRVLYKRAEARLEPTAFTLKPRGNGLFFEIPKPFPLEIAKLPLKIGRIAGTIGDATELSTALSLKDVPLKRLNRIFCLGMKSVPPATASASFKDVTLTPLSISASGYAKLKLFSGAAEIGEVSVFDYLSPVPEVNFDARWSGMKLQELGDWLDFGKMDGEINGYAKNVTFQSWLPTHYDFRFSLEPMSKSDIVFSPKAMKNFIQLFTEDGLTAMPGILDWLMFSWPSELLGYDLAYAGLSLFSSDGSILLETHDPPKIFKREEKRFILYGQRFKMPLNTPRYPVILDATAVWNYVRNLSAYLGRMASEAELKEAEKKSKQPSKDIEDEQENPDEKCIHPDFDRV